MPTPAVTGIRFAFEPGTGRAAVPVRSALVGTVLAVALVVATLTFASGLHTLVSHPSLYGWNWNYMHQPEPRGTAADPEAPRPRPRRRRLERRRLHRRRDQRSERSRSLARRAPWSPSRFSGSRPRREQPDRGRGNDPRPSCTNTSAKRGRELRPPVDAPATSRRPAQDRRDRHFPGVGFESFVADHTSMGTGGAVLPD